MLSHAFLGGESMGNFAIARDLRGMDTELTRALTRADRGGSDLGAIAETVRGHLSAASTRLESAVTGMEQPGVDDALRSHLFDVGGIQPIVTPTGLRDSIARASEAWQQAPTDAESLRTARNTLVLPHERSEVATEGVHLINPRLAIGLTASGGFLALAGLRAAIGSQAAPTP